MCKIHGSFYQSPDNHLAGHGCTKCCNEESAKRLAGNTWKYSQWEQVAQTSKHFDSFKVYVIECWDENERFFKIGKTFMTVSKRLSKGSFPYNFSVIKIYTGNFRSLSELEKIIQNNNKMYRYIPKKKFHGYQECFLNIKIVDDYD